MNNKDENLKELLNKFYAEAEAAKAEEDILRGEQIIADNPAPRPDAQQMRFVKLQVNAELKRTAKTEKLSRWRWALTAAAGIVIAAGLVFVHNYQFRDERPASIAEIPKANVEDSDFSFDDTELELLAADIEAVEDEILALQLGENGTEWISADDIEIELLEINEDFWKG